MLNLTDLFKTFLKEKQFLEGASPRTIYIYSKAWLAFERYGKKDLTEEGLKDFFIWMVDSNLRPRSANTYARALNSFLTWLYETDKISTRLKIPLQKPDKKVLRTYSKEEILKITSHRPTNSTGKRIMTILIFLVDTGARVSEAISLTRGNIDFDNLLVTLKGKGNKERKVPISIECRKVLYRWIQTHSHELVFCTERGTKLRYDNVRRDFLSLLKSAGVAKTEGSFHAFRRYFGKDYVRNGGNVLYLQRVFGHASLETTKVYVNMDEEDLKMAHRLLSPLENLKK